MRLTMRERRVSIKSFAPRYRQSGKKVKVNFIIDPLQTSRIY